MFWLKYRHQLTMVLLLVITTILTLSIRSGFEIWRAGQVFVICIEFVMLLITFQTLKVYEDEHWECYWCLHILPIDVHTEN